MRRTFLASLLAACAGGLQADDDMAQLADLFPTGRHLTELTYTRIDTVFGDQDVWIPRYTYAYSTSLRLAASVGYVESAPSDAGRDRGGQTDSVFLLQYDPSAQLTANAFVPDTVGLTMALQAPTGDHDKGIGEDLWAAQLGAGWLVDFPWDFWLLPSLQHEWTFSEGQDAQERERTDLGLGLYWLFPFKAWLGIEPGFAYDHVLDDSAFDWSIVLGKVWSSGWGVDVRWTNADRLEPRGVRDDEILFFALTYQFGAPPRGAN